MQLFAHAMLSVSSQVSRSELASARVRLSQLECWSDIITAHWPSQLSSQYKLDDLSFSLWH